MSGTITKRKRKPIEYYVNENGCHICTSHTTDPKGYARICALGSRCFPMHRYIYYLNHGPIPPKMEVRHTCDNPTCINPDHLLLGTHADNMRDMAIRGRNKKPKGGDSPSAKLSLEQMLFIIENKDMSYAELSKILNISYTTIGDILHGKTWQNIDALRLEPGRAKGDRNGNAKLTADKVKDILNDNSMTVPQLSKKYNVGKSAIYSILRNETWKHIEPNIERTMPSQKSKDIKYRKLSENDVIDIFKNNDDTISTLMGRYNVSRRMIFLIKAGQCWRHITQNINQE